MTKPMRSAPFRFILRICRKRSHNEDDYVHFFRFSKLYGIRHSHIVAMRSFECGNKFVYKPMDVLFMNLVAMKRKVSWDQHGHSFQINGTTFMRLITVFMDKAVDFCADLFMTKWEKKLSKAHLIKNGLLFQNVPSAFESIDSTFQQASGHSGSILEGRFIFQARENYTATRWRFLPVRSESRIIQ